MSAALKLYVESEAALEPPENQITLLDLLRLRTEAERRRRGKEGSDSSRRDYERAIRRYAEFCGEHADSLSACSVSWQKLYDFQDHVLEHGSRETNKEIACLACLLRFGAKRNLIPTAPQKVDSVAARTAAEILTYEVEEINRIYYACESATWPTQASGCKSLSYSPAAGWKAAIVLLVNYGFRTQDVIAYEPKKRPIPCRNVSFSAKTTNPEGSAANEHGWLKVRIQKTQRTVFLPMNRVVAAHLRPIMNQRSPESRLFDWPQCSRGLYKQWRSILKKAGVQERISADTNLPIPWEIEHFRKTCNSLHDLNRPGSGKLVLGHSGGDVNTTHYLQTEQIFVEVMNSFPQPAAFLDVFQQFDRQRRLF